MIPATYDGGGDLMVRGQDPDAITPATAAYILDRLIAEHRVSRADVAQYLSELPRDIRAVELRLKQLLGDSVPAGSSQPTMRATRTRHKTASRKVHASRTSHPINGMSAKALGGTYGGLIRRLPKAEQMHYETLKKRDGIVAAIAALKSRTR